MFEQKIIHCIGYASDIAGSAPGSGDGPGVLQKSSFFQTMKSAHLALRWQELIFPPASPISKLEKVRESCVQLAKAVELCIKQRTFFAVFGGDHTSAIGTWSGVRQSLPEKDELGLIWIDAHMDSHTPETTQTGNLHGMPLAVLLGYGESSLVNIEGGKPKINPENLCLVGVRSFERGEAELLEKLRVRIFYMDEVKKRGMPAVIEEAIARVKAKTRYFGVSLDIDAIDPMDAPGTGIAEPDGIAAADILLAFQRLATEKQLIGIELAEFDPHRDKEAVTEALISKLIVSMG